MISTEVVFRGSAADKALADKVFQVMTGYARFSSIDAPIRLTSVALAEFLTSIGTEATPEKLQSIAKLNSLVFALETVEEETFVLTTRAGRAPVEASLDAMHSFAVRFMTPLPKPERPAQPRERVAPPEPSWMRDVISPVEALDLPPTYAPLASRPTPITPERIAPERIAPERTTPDRLAPERIVPEWAASMPRMVERARVEPVAQAIDEPTAMPTTDEVLVDVAPAAAVVAAETVAAPLPVVEEVVVPVIAPTPPPRTITVPHVEVQSFGGVDDVRLATAIGDRLRMDPRVANFGEDWMLEERVPRLGRNDLRRLRDYLQEQEQPLTDEMLAQDVLGGRPGNADFEQLRFAVNFRLSREHRDFDFVGTVNQRFWSTGSLPQIGTTRKKPTEIASDYRVLADDSSEPTVPRSIASVDHILTFYEHSLGLLPYNRDIQGLLPSPLMPNQRSAVLTFECPQSYTTYLVELRYPTPNRGGFILGLDDFFNENLVPGALLSIERTDNDGHYLVRYIQEKPKSVRMLELEDRRQRYVFRPTTYACGVVDDYLLTEERYPTMASEKPLDEKSRRRPEAVLSTSFERIGRKLETGTGFAATFTELFAITNIERPFSEAFIRNVLDSDESGAFAKDPDTDDGYTYVPGSPS